jgi:hypothetical protein
VAEHSLLGQCCHSSRNLSVNRYIRDPDFLHRGDKGTRFAGVTIEKSFAREGGDVLHDRRLAGEAKMILDSARAGGDTLLALLALDKIQHASLPIGQHLRKECSVLVQAQVQMNMGRWRAGIPPYTVEVNRESRIVIRLGREAFAAGTV